MAVHITTTQQAAQLHGIKCLVYGKSGAGKTKLAATAPAPIILSAESGILSLREFQIPMIQIKTVADLTEVHQWALNSAEGLNFRCSRDTEVIVWSGTCVSDCRV